MNTMQGLSSMGLNPTQSYFDMQLNGSNPLGFSGSLSGTSMSSYPSVFNQNSLDTTTPIGQNNLSNMSSALNDELVKSMKFNNSWLGGKGLSALQGLGSLMSMYTGYQAYKENKKNSKLQREIARYNLDQNKKEYARLQGQRKTATKSYNI